MGPRRIDPADERTRMNPRQLDIEARGALNTPLEIYRWT